MGANTSTGSYPPIMTTSGGGQSSGGIGSGTSASFNVMLSNSAVATGLSASSSGGSSIIAGMGGPHTREQRRKRVTGFATLKRKFIRRRRSSKACDHARVLRDFVSDWTPLELAALCEEYEALAALRDLSVNIINISTLGHACVMLNLQLLPRCKLNWRVHLQPLTNKIWLHYMI